MKVLRLGEHYTEITGRQRDDFVAELLDCRESDEDDLLLDFTGVERLSSIALAAVGKLHVWMEEHGRKLQVRGLSPNLYQLFQITGMVEMLEIIDPPSEKPSQDLS